MPHRFRRHFVWFLASALLIGAAGTALLYDVVPLALVLAVAGIILFMFPFSTRTPANSSNEEKPSPHASRRRLEAMMENGRDIQLLVTHTGEILYAGGSVKRLLLYSSEELTRLNSFEILHPDDVPSAQQALRQVIERDPEVVDITVRVRRSDGAFCYFELSGTDCTGDPDIGGVVVSARDVTMREQLRGELAFQATHDSLTGLPNRRLLTERLQTLTAAGGRTGLLFIDLDGFKLVNDSLGHAAGDALLMTVAARIKGCVRQADTVARFGGDEFVVLLSEVRDSGVVAQTAQRIINAVSAPMSLNGNAVTVSCSAGLVVNRAGSATPEELLRQGDIALYQAKQAGKARAVWFEPSMGPLATERLDLASGLRQAMTQGELELHYLPEIDFKDGSVCRIEALLRWRHSDRGLLKPADFMAQAEDAGLTGALCAWLIESACRQAFAWRAQGGPAVVLSIQLSARQFDQPDLVAQVGHALHETGLAPTRLQIEVGESALLANPEGAKYTLIALRQLGVRLAICDFGVGYSSLGFLQRFSFDALKIDQAAIVRVPEDAATAALVRAALAAAQVLGIEVAGCGIEREEQLAFLRQLGCASGNGPFFSEPMPGTELAAMRQAGARIDPERGATAGAPGSRIQLP